MAYSKHTGTKALPIDALPITDPFWDPQHPLRQIQAGFYNGAELNGGDAKVIAQYIQDPDIRVNNLAFSLHCIQIGQPEKMQFALSMCAEQQRRKLAAGQEPVVQPKQPTERYQDIPTYKECRGTIPTYKVEKGRVVRSGPEQGL